MARKFSKESEKLFDKAIQRYNSMAARARQYHLMYNKEQIKKDLMDTEELRNFVKKLNDYKKITDFETVEVNPFLVLTKGEINTAKRLNKAAKAKSTKRINRINKAIKAVEETGEQVPKELIERRAEARFYERDIFSLQKEGFEKRLQTYEREALKRKTRAKNTYKNNYIQRVKDLQEITGVNLSKQIKKLQSMSLDRFVKFAEEFPLKDYLYEIEDMLSVANILNEMEELNGFIVVILRVPQI